MMKKLERKQYQNLKFIVHDIWKEQNLIDVSTPSYLTVNLKILKPTT